MMRGQSSVEFASLMGFMLLVFTLYFSAVTNRFVEVEAANARSAIEDVSGYMQAELGLAAAASDGYYREFEIPEQIGGRAYNISILAASPGLSNHTELTIYYLNASPPVMHTVLLPSSIRGSINVASSQVVRVSKQNGIVVVGN
jgi:hypothetical protein